MKKTITLIMTMVFIMMLSVGCSENTDSTQSLSKDTSMSKSTEEVDSDSEISYAKMIPDPKIIFKDGEMNIIDSDGGEMYCFTIKNFNEDEYKKYVSECKNMGFDDVSYETDDNGVKMFGAYSTDGVYWVQTQLMDDQITVTCNKSKNK